MRGKHPIGNNAERMSEVQDVLVELTSALEHKSVVMLWKEILKHTGEHATFNIL